MPTDDPKDPAPRRRKRAAEIGATGPDAADTGRKVTRARKPASGNRPARAKRTRVDDADAPEVDAAATVSESEEVDAPATAAEAEVARARSEAGATGALPADGGEHAAGVEVDGASGGDAEHAARRVKVETTLTALLERAELPATLDVRDLPDGTFSVAVRFATLPPGVQVGRRSPFMDSLQFLTNKLLHQPRSPGRRWVTLGAMEHPPPRGPKAVKVDGAPSSAEPAAERRKGREKAAQKGTVAAEALRADERHLEVVPDPALAAAAQHLAERSAKYGRLYTVLAMGEADRARVVQAAAQVEGLRVSCEGEGRHRRVIFRPDAPAPLPKRTLPDWDDDEDLD